jgi:hypothetical protein
MTTLRIVLPDSISEQDVDAAAWDNHWSLVRTISADANTPHEVVWHDSTQNVTIHYIEDFYIGFAYLVLQGDILDLVIEDIYASLPQAYQVSDIFAMLDTTKNLTQPIYCLGLIAPPTFNQIFFDRLRQALTHSDPKIRSATITAIAYTGWPEFRSALQSLYQSEFDPEVRKDAEVLLSGFEQQSHEAVIAS